MAKTEILKLIDEVRSKDRSIMELESQVKKLSEEGHRVWLKEEASRGKWLDAKERRQAARVSVLQGKLSQAHGAASLREENLLQELKRAKEEKEKEANLLRQEAKKKE